MAKDINVNSVEWCDLIFEGKNKDYGAYELRKYSPRRHLTAYVVIIGCGSGNGSSGFCSFSDTR